MVDKKIVLIAECKDYDSNNVSRVIDIIFDTFSMACVFSKGNILIKPNLCLSVSPDQNITTHPEIVNQIIKKVQDKFHLIIGESHIGDLRKKQIQELWENTGIDNLVNQYGLKRSIFNERTQPYDVGMGKALFSDIIFESDIINVPKLKTHGFMLLTGCIKNMYGLLPGNSKKHYHKIYSNPHEFARFLTEVYSFSNVRLNIVDAVMCLQGNGPGMRGSSKHMGLIVAGIDGFSVDRVLCKLMGIQPSRVMTNWFGNIPIEELDDLHDIEIIGEIDKYKSQFLLPDSYDLKQKFISKAFQLIRSSVAIDNEKCKKCGQCKANCPQEAIEQKSGEYFINNQLCIQCYVCDESCKHNAIYFHDHSLIKNIFSRRQDT